LFSERYVISAYFANALLTAARYAALVMVSDGQRETGAEPKGERQSMDVIYDLHSWSKQRRERCPECAVVVIGRERREIPNDRIR
jgi:hypothetical protein